MKPETFKAVLRGAAVAVLFIIIFCADSLIEFIL